MNDAKQHYLDECEIRQLKKYFGRHKLRWTPPRQQLLAKGQNGKLPDSSYDMYKKLLQRMLLEMERERKGELPPLIISGRDTLPLRYY